MPEPLSDPEPDAETSPAHPVARAAEVVVYAPLGFLLEAPHLLPDLARRGRREVEVMRALGGELVATTHHWVWRRLRHAAGETRSALENLDGRAPEEPPLPATPAAEEPLVVRPDPGAPTLAPPVHDEADRAEIPAAESLAIPDYDNLSASQVVPRLEGLDTDERDAVRRYELGHRARRTILNRIAQLQGT